MPSLSRSVESSEAADFRLLQALHPVRDTHERGARSDCLPQLDRPRRY
jgi:hypothetical protein